MLKQLQLRYLRFNSIEVVLPGMPSKVFSAAIVGLDAKIVEVETDVAFGLRSFNIVGLADKAIEESKHRINSAIKATKLSTPNQSTSKVLINLAPADLRKEGSHYDLSIALGYLLATEQTRFLSSDKIFLGELSLDSKLRPVRGALSFAMAAAQNGFKEIILPKANTQEAALIQEIKVIGVEDLKEAIEYLEGKREIGASKVDFLSFLENPPVLIDLGYIKGQEMVKRALEIVAAGGHNLLMVGPPGAGKTLLAQGITSILPKLSFEEALELTKIYSVSGYLPPEMPLVNFRPFRSPHHTSSEVSLIGGGNPPRPGEITLSHRGVLFLDEFPEFHRDVLESLRQPLEDGRITILRSKHFLTLPAKFILIGASNPCPCGYYHDPERMCRCTSSQIAKYRRKLSGPLIDRFDFYLEVPSIKYEKLIAPDEENLSADVRKRVESSRQIQKQRFKNEKILTNSELNLPLIKKYCQIDSPSHNFLRKFVDSGKLSARGYHRILKVSRTIADLEGSETIRFSHVSEAVTYRIKEEKDF